MKYQIGVRRKPQRGRKVALVMCLTAMVTAVGLYGAVGSAMGRFGVQNLPWPPPLLSYSDIIAYHNGNSPSVNNSRNGKKAIKKTEAKMGPIKHIAGTPAELLTDITWHLPGSVQAPDGSLTVRSVPFAIVEQDGSGGQPNPPVNLFGTRLSVSGDFELTFDMRGTGDTTAAVQLYGSVPVIADEFRIERQSVRFSIAGDTLTVSLWNGSAQLPAVQAFDIPPSDDQRLTVVRSGGQLSFGLNDQAIGSVSETNIFKGGQLWFGMDASGGNGWKLNSLSVTGNAQMYDTSADARVPRDPNGLQAAANKQRPDLLIGAAMALGPLTADGEYRYTALSNFGAMTTENALKWQFVHPTPDAYDFTEADALVAIAQQHDMAVHAHTLVFGEANPTWVRNLALSERQAAMLQHIKAVAGHLKGKVASWDVINEPFDDEEWSSLRQHLWYQAMGENYIPLALQAARQADPNAKLFINDYGLEEDGERWDAMLALVTKLKQQGIPLDGVGFQSHVYASTDKIDPAVLRKHIQQLAALGLSARVSEIDVYSEDGQQVQATQYQQVLSACVAEPTCVSYTTWGVSDRYNWFKDEGSIEQGQDFLWDKDMKPTPAVNALRQLFP